MLYNLVRKKKRKHGHRQEWTAEERAAVNRHFAEDIMCHRVPRKDACVKCIEAEPSLGKRDWKSVKYFVHTAGQKKRRVL